MTQRGTVGDYTIDHEFTNEEFDYIVKHKPGPGWGALVMPALDQTSFAKIDGRERKQMCRAYVKAHPEMFLHLLGQSTAPRPALAAGGGPW